MSNLDTIFALSTGTGRSGVAVIRISGPASRTVIESLAGPAPEPRRATLRSIRDQDGLLIDRGLVLWFPGPDSFTGEDCAELQVHGSSAVIADILRAVGQCPGCRPAEAGAFARRAFENGKLDLTAVEGLADLIEAETTAQRRAALRQADGELQRLFDNWRSQLLQAMALVEAAIDFSDEGDVAVGVMAQALPIVDKLQSEISDHLIETDRARGLREGLTLCLAGPPNVGKSSLMNWLTQRDVAIVDPTPGTTRDRLESRIEIEGVPVTLLDTAGLRAEPASPIEASGIERARAARDAADIVLWLESSDTCLQGSGPGARFDSQPQWIRIRNKVDLDDEEQCELADSDALSISVTREIGLDSLMDRIRCAVSELAGLTEQPIASRLRHSAILTDVLSTLKAIASVRKDEPELVGEHLRQAANGVGQLTGRVDVEEVLGSIFSEFCIGK
ncbi:MAG: tRNA uridine-5-carboxymethylaminomethyl(34) synthesis GTPase MnmE [Pseudomonadota bacterium]